MKQTLAERCKMLEEANKAANKLLGEQADLTDMYAKKAAELQEELDTEWEAQAGASM